MSDPGNYAGSADRSLGQLVASATAELSALVHDEIALAKAEVRQDVKRGVIGSVAFIVTGVLILFAIPVLSFAAAYGIHNLGLGLAWSFLIVGGAFILLGILLALFGLAKFKKVKPPEKSIASAKQTAAVLQGVKPHPRASVGADAILPVGGSTLADKAIENRPVQDKASAVARSST
ncbi:phage holin family protein [Streptomyces sp. NBC_01220]|uniref:phage holin family protein n=1 Tax=unclassified Streptomyces TaxID=2593676 RepID=UPI002E29D7D7|nr:MULTISPECIES: phage holin family protein [unclassified Streptomyces]WSQ45484.1 phage holin family protein [Streptomyces sp. NBC_01220]